MKALTAHHLTLLQEAADRVRKPFFAYDLDGLRSHAMTLRSEGVRLWYACKANPLSAILRTMGACSFSADAASLGELRQILRYSGIAPKNILLTGPAKDEAFVTEALNAGVCTIIVESVHQLEMLQQLASTTHKPIQVLLRLQLDWDEKSASVLGGSAITPFGLPPEVWQSVSWKSFPHCDVLGCHVFQWSNIGDIEKLNFFWHRIAVESKRLMQHIGKPLEVLDLGGGLGVPYHADARELRWIEVDDALQKIRKQYEIPSIWLELGRYAVGGFGNYLTRVIDRKQVRGTELLILEGGVNHIARPALTHASFPVHTLKPSSAKTQSFKLHGPLCTALDDLGLHDLPEDIQRGDWLVFRQCGAYGFTESMPYFLCHDIPAEIIIENNQYAVVRESVPAENWLK